MVEQDKDALFKKAKQYSNLKYSLALIDTAYLLVLLFIFAASGGARILAQIITPWVVNRYLAIPIYILIISLLYYLLNFPLNFYRSFILEHRFCLSTQKVSQWLLDQVKTGIISYIIGIILVEAFYYLLAAYPFFWWLIVALFWIFFSFILAKLLPVIIIPLFFKYRRLCDNTLRERVKNLALKMGIKILDVFEIDFSKKTLKANAAFVGWGATKRVILADTLKDKYTAEEIEVILAHEFAHYKLKHLFKLILLNSCTTILVFYLIFKTSNFVLNLFGLSSLLELASLPLIVMYFVIFGIIMQPGENYLSRKLERNADSLALKATHLKEAFISMMDKLALQNLADRNPHPLVKFFFFDHPPIDERIAMAKNL